MALLYLLDLVVPCGRSFLFCFFLSLLKLLSSAKRGRLSFPGLSLGLSVAGIDQGYDTLCNFPTDKVTTPVTSRQPHAISPEVTDRNGLPPPAPLLAETLADPAAWGAVEHFFEANLIPRTCVMYGGRRYCVAPHHHTDHTLIEHVVQTLRLDVHRIATCAFRADDFDVRGPHCRWTVAVADVPAIADSPASHARQDYIVLCDLRPLGLKPVFLHTHVPKIHVPSFLSDFGVDLPRARQLGIQGGRLRKDYVSFDGSCVLLFFAVEADPFLRADSSSDEEIALESRGPSSPFPQHDMPTEGEDDAFSFESRERNPERHLLDPTIPAGHSWNAGIEIDPHSRVQPAHDLGAQNDSTGDGDVLRTIGDPDLRPDTGSYTGDSGPVSLAASASNPLPAPSADVDVGDDAPVPAEPVPLRAYVFVPDVVPEMLTASAFLPCSVDTAMAAVAAARQTEDILRFPRCVPATPQPFADCVLAVAAPHWFEQRPVVLLDCRRINFTIFAKALHPRLNRESLLLAAGQPHDSRWDIFVHGLLHPLQREQIITLRTGMLITFEPEGCGAPAAYDLAARLITRTDWDPDFELPVAGSYPGQYFWVLTDGMPTLFEVAPWRRRSFTHDLAQHLQESAHSLVLKPSHPRIIDGYFNGRLTSGLIIATRQVCRLPCPPVRRKDTRLLVFVDARPVMQGFQWLIAEHAALPVEAVTRRFEDGCLDGYLITVSGAEVSSFGDERFLSLEDGLLLVVEYKEEEFELLSAPVTSPPGNDDDDAPEGDSTRRAPGLDGSASDVNTRATLLRNRSRSPRGGTVPPTSTVACCNSFTRTWRIERCRRVVTWGASLIHDALAESHWPLTPVLRQLWSPYRWMASSSQGFPIVRLPCWFVRHWSDLLGNQAATPYEDDAGTRPSPGRISDDADASDTDSDYTMIDAVFVLLAPDYASEEVTINIMVPQSVGEAFDVLDTCRGLANKELFPTLCMVWPQPDPRWAVALMLPAWINGEVVCCCDLTRWDGRVFAAKVPRVVDRHRLLLVAGLSSRADVDVLLPAYDVPLLPGEEAVLTMGDCVCFVPAESPREPVVSLREMLHTHLPWMPGPAFAWPADDRYCVVSDDSYCDFLLLPDRAFTYRADIASRLALSPHNFVLTPAVPRLHDVAVVGKACRTVVAAGTYRPSSNAGTPHICLLDCRPVFQGWFRCTAPSGWLDLRPFRDAFSQGAPEGWMPSFEGCANHWIWRWVEPGEVVRVTFVPADTPPCQEDAGGTVQVPLSTLPSAPTFSSPVNARMSDHTVGDAAPFARLFPQGVPEVVPRAFLALTCIGLGGTRLSPFAADGVFPRRASQAGPEAESLDIVDLSRPITLLELSAGEQECPAFFLAAVLVETLVEHFTQSPLVYDDTLAVAGNARTTLVLDSLLPSTPECADLLVTPTANCSPTEFFDLEARTCALPCNDALLDELLQTLPFCALRGPTGYLPQPDRFSDWVAQSCMGRSPAPDELLVVTTDGSYDPRSGAAGWAVVISLAADNDYLLPGQLIGCFAGSLQSLRDACDTDFGPNNAYLAEVAALFWGACIAVKLPGPRRCIFRADNISALFGVGGQVQLQSHPLCVAAGAVHASARLLGRQISYQHVAGHSSDPANELADALAGVASRTAGPNFPFPIRLSAWFAHDGAAIRWLPHLCYMHARPETLPTMKDGVMSWSRDKDPLSVPPAEVMRPFLRVSDGCGPPRMIPRPDAVNFRFASFNALSLLDTSGPSHAAGLHGATGRVKLLCASLHSCGITVVGLQECRTFRNTMSCMGFRRYASGRDDNACYGVELWVAEQGILDVDAVTVLHTDPTFMVASVPFRGTRLCILVAHGPHRVHPDSVRLAWWEKVSGVCSAHSRDARWLVLGDCNCPVGSHTGAGVGDHQSDEEDMAGECFRLLLDDLDCWLPSTFSETAYGEGGTLYQKRNGEMDRSDFVALPRDWPFAHCCAWVEPSISAGHRCLDHFAAAVACTLHFQDTFKARAKARRIDAKALADPDNFETIDCILASAPTASWTTDASEHVAGIVDHVYRGLAAAFPQQKRRMRGQQFSDETQRLHHLVCTLRHSARTRAHALRDTLSRCALLAWKGKVGLHTVYQGRWLWRLRIRHALDCILLRRYGGQLRASCRTDRKVHLGALARQIAESPCGELHRAVRKVMRPKKYRRDGQPLPMLRDEDGSVCASQTEATQVWREHFRVLEAGLATTPAQLATTCTDRQSAFEGTDVVDARYLPTWDHLLSAFRHASPHKASGPDLLPPVLCRVFSQRLTEVFWPVMMKAVLRANEAVGLKGGVLHKIAKPSAVNNTTAGFRGILVQSCLSKVLHRAVRHLAVDHWQDHALPMQIGGRKGCPADFGQFCSRAYLAYARQQNISAAILFVDISAAYYGVIREAILGAQGDGRPIEALASSLGLSRDDLQRLQYFINEEPVLRTQQASDLLCEVANELHQNTWFLLSGDTQLIETYRGTRPGGSLADVIFNILFCKVLDRRDKAAFCQHVPQVAWAGVRSPWANHGGQDQVCRITEVSDVVYADDLASFLGCRQAAHLPGALSGAAAETVDTLLPHGLNANVGPTKTAAVVAPAGPGSRAVRGDLYGTRRGRLSVLPENRGAFLLDLVPAYRHLGSYITHNGCMLMEIRHRLAAGRAALKEGKQRLFACRSIPLARRVDIFKVHVLAAVLSGVGTWPALNGQEQQLFSGGVISMYRQLLCLRAEGGFSCTFIQIVARVGMLQPSGLLHVARIRFLGQLVRHGPDPAWALLSHFVGFQQAIRDAASWVLRAVGAVCDLGDIEADWDKWESLFRSSPGRVRTLLKRAETWHLLLDGISAALDVFGRSQWDDDPSACRLPISDCSHACLPCKLAFHTRQQWGAHAHRVHAYHSRAHKIAKGRQCGACGLQVASLGRLRTHLRLSPACVTGMEQAVNAGTFSADMTTAHELAPAVPGIGKGALAPAPPETVPELRLALDALVPAADCDTVIFDLVSQHIAPLPVLRRTLEEWSASLLPGPLHDAARDVLLVLRPEHLCDRVSGKKARLSPLPSDFVPHIRPLILSPPIPELPVYTCGPCASQWAQDFGLTHLPVRDIALVDFKSWAWQQAAAACVTFTPPFSGMVSVFSPPSCSIRDMRQLSDWTHSLLSALRPLLLLAKLGRPVRLRFPFPPLALEPLSDWLATLSGTESIEPEAQIDLVPAKSPSSVGRARSAEAQRVWRRWEDSDLRVHQEKSDERVARKRQQILEELKHREDEQCTFTPQLIARRSRSCERLGVQSGSPTTPGRAWQVVQVSWYGGLTHRPRITRAAQRLSADRSDQ
ncbi:hypothetical protein AK812_SmicGene43255, partial [Symbiodinium microadriaticum]